MRYGLRATNAMNALPVFRQEADLSAVLVTRYASRSFRHGLPLCLTALLFSPSLLSAQLKLQHHYDISRQIFTSTAEFLFHDPLGTTFGFTDINYDSYHYDKPGATDVYFELARYFTIPRVQKNLSWTVQYNDGVIFFPGTDTTLFSGVSRAWLAGLSYLVPWKDAVFSVDFLARYEGGDTRPAYQLTLVLFFPLSGRFSFTGFLDLWNSEKDGTVILLTEPQFLVSFGKWEAGMELEVSRNFPGAWTRNQSYRPSKTFFLPTVFLKYTF